MDCPVETLLDTKFVKVFDLRYAPGAHYINATRRPKEELVCRMSDDRFRAMVPDAVSLCVIWHEKDGPDRILLNREFRYPLGQYVTSVPAGLIDPEDRAKPREEAIFDTAWRELYEETGIARREEDRISLLNPCLFSSPGLTDESNAMVRIDLHGHERSELTQSHAVGTEKFEGFRMADREEARRMMAEEPVSVYTWIGLAAFLNP